MLLIVIVLIRDKLPEMAGRITEIGPSGIKLAEVVATQQRLQKEVEQIKGVPQDGWIHSVEQNCWGFCDPRGA